MSLYRPPPGRILVESHRGTEVGAEPNTLAALAEGARRGADLVEVDVQVSRDGVPFLRHHYAGGDGRWAWECDYAELPGCPRLEEALAWSREAGVPLTLDLKSPFGGGDELLEAVLALLREDDAVGACAWDHGLLAALKRRRPLTSTRANLRARPVDLVAMLAPTGCDAVALSYDLARPEDVEAAHGAGLAVAVAELFRPDWERVRALGVDLVCYGDAAAARLGIGGDAC